MVPAILCPLLSLVSDRTSFALPSHLHFAPFCAPGLGNWQSIKQSIVCSSVPRYLDKQRIACAFGFLLYPRNRLPPTTCTLTCTPGSSTLTVPHANARVRQRRNSSTSSCDLADVDPSTSTSSYAIHCQRRLSRAHDAFLTFYKPSPPHLTYLFVASRVLRRSEPARVGKHKTGHHTIRPSHYRYTATTRIFSSLVDESQLPLSPTRLAFPDHPLQSCSGSSILPPIPPPTNSSPEGKLVHIDSLQARHDISSLRLIHLQKATYLLV